MWIDITNVGKMIKFIQIGSHGEQDMKNRSATKRKAYKLQFRTIMTSLLVTSLSILLVWGTSAAGTVNAVNGTIDDGKIITINGSGFGSSGPNIVLFDDFESGTPGNDIKTGTGSAKYGQWDSRAGSSYYGNTAKVSGSKSFTSDYVASYGNAISTLLPANTRNVFISWWLFVPAGNNWPGEISPDGINWKQMWLMGSGSGDDDLVIPTRLGPASWFIVGNEQNPGYSNWTSVGMVKGEWKRLWTWLKGSTSSTSNDGELKFWELANTGVIQRENAIGINNLKAGGAWERVKPNAYGRQTSNCIVSFDDIYVASGPNAQARVEIGNAANYMDSTKLTILTPTSWTDSSISVQVNTGQFKTNENAFLFIFKADGSVSNGYPIKIGATINDGTSGLVPLPDTPEFRLSSNN